MRFESPPKPKKKKQEPLYRQPVTISSLKRDMEAHFREVTKCVHAATSKILGAMVLGPNAISEMKAEVHREMESLKTTLSAQNVYANAAQLTQQLLMQAQDAPRDATVSVFSTSTPRKDILVGSDQDIELQKQTPAIPMQKTVNSVVEANFGQRSNLMIRLVKHSALG